MTGVRPVIKRLAPVWPVTGRRSLGLAIQGLALAALAGCTTALATYPEQQRAGDLPSFGIPYRLPATQFSVSVSWTIDECSPAPETDEASETDDPMGLVGFKASGAFTAATIEGESRVIDYRDLTTAFKTGQIKVEYHDKTMLVKSINAEIKGREAEAVGAALKFGGNVARLFLGLPAPAAAGGQAAGNSTPCLDPTVAMVDALKTAQARIKAIPAASKTLEDRMAVLRSRVAGGKLTEADEKELERLQGEADKLASDLLELKASAERLKSSLTFASTFKFPTSSSQRTATVDVSEEKLRKWLRSVLKPTPANTVPAPGFSTSVSLQPLVDEATCETPCNQKVVAPGFVFRQPVEAALTVTVPNEAKPLVSETVSVAQFGRLRVLPLVSDWGENNTLNATFAADGRPTMVEYKALAAPGVDAINLANDGAKTLLALAGEIEKQKEADEAEEKADKAAADKAELDALTHQVALLEAQAKLDKLQQPTAPDIETLEAQLAVLRLQKEKAELEAAIRKAAPQ